MAEEYFINAKGNYGGDKIEKYGWPVFGESRFPNYEFFWKEYIIPKTNRPKDIHFSVSVNTIEKEICSIHYSIYSHFYTIFSYIERGAIYRDTFDYCIMRLSNICDLTEEFLYKLSIDRKLIDEDSDVVTPNINKILTKAKAADNKTVFKTLKDSSNCNILVKLRLDVLKRLYNLDKYIQISKPIRQYRNTVVHSWQTYQYNDMVPSFEKVKEYQDYLKITEILKEKDSKKKEKMVNADFIPMNKLLISATEGLIKEINTLWEQITNNRIKAYNNKHEKHNMHFAPGISSGLHTEPTICNIPLSAHHIDE